MWEDEKGGQVKRRHRERMPQGRVRRVFWRYRRRLIVAGLLVVVLAGLWAWKKDGVMRRIDEARAGALARKAVVCIEEGDYRTASKQLNKAFRLGRDEPDVLRGMGTFFERVDPKQAIGFLRRLWRRGEATPEDAVMLLGHYGKVGQMTDADPFADELLERYPRSRGGAFWGEPGAA
jgi:Tfp pilus assembly protein PilF